jgi:catechol 2,3-dioxygenase-like lactoylglutathione lyase family enzyme
MRHEYEGLGHIGLTVTDGERGVRWWTEVLGLRLLTTLARRHNHPLTSAWDVVSMASRH